MTRLFIEGQEIELNENSIFAINSEYSALTDPTTISNDWSKTVNVPETLHNNLVFGTLYRADRRVTDDGTTTTGLYFNANKKLNMLLVNGSSNVIMDGYAKMTSITRKNNITTYHLNLYGTLGKVFTEMQKITFYPTETENDEKYYIDGKQYVNGVINKDLIHQLWNTSYVNSWQKSLEDSLIGDIIGFTPLNALYEDFEAESYQTDILEEEVYKRQGTKSFDEELHTVWKEDKLLNDDYDTDSLIGDGLLPRAVGDFRSYYQLPFIFFNKFYQIFKEKFEDVTDYTLNIDSNWANGNNPYWYKLVFLGKSLHTGGEQNKTAFYLTNLGKPVDSYDIVNAVAFSDKATGAGIHKYNELLEIQIPIPDVVNSEYFDKSTNRFLLSDERNIMIDNTLKFRICTPHFAGADYIQFRNHSLLDMQIVFQGENDHTEIIHNIIVDEDNDYDWQSDFDNVYVVERNRATTTTTRMGWDINLNVTKLLLKSVYGNSVKMYLRPIWQLYRTETTPFDFNNLYTNDRIVYIGTISSTVLNATAIEGDKRSNDIFTLNDLWDRDVLPFDILLRYCKMFGLLFTVDDINKSVNIIHRTDYFNKYTVEDWTDRVDFKQDYELKPASFEHKYMVFNYEDSDIANAKSYKEKFGINYGEIKVDTSYAFDEESEDLFSDINTSLTYTPIILDYNSMKKQHFVFIGSNDTLINVNDDDDRAVESFGSFYFYRGIKQWDYNLPTPYITDDTPLMVTQDNYMYIADSTHLPEYMIETTNYSRLDVVDTLILRGGTYIDRISLFNTPSETYDTGNNYKYCNSIYDIYWKKYVNEIYNFSNNALTAYIRITPEDYVNFDFNHFVVIDNILYRVNKIYDYSPDDYNTKCELVQITDISAYTTTGTLKIGQPR